jgi:hypothetical protein
MADVVIKVDGPRAQELADTMTKEGGLAVVVDGDGHLMRAIGPPSSRVSQTLHNLLNEVINSNKVVTVNAFGHPPSRLLLGDSFFGGHFPADPKMNRPHRSVFVSDMNDIFAKTKV